MPVAVLVLVFDVDGRLDQPHNSNPRPASAAALLRQELAATSAAGAFDSDSSGSDAYLLTKPHKHSLNYSLQQQRHHLMSFE